MSASTTRYAIRNVKTGLFSDGNSGCTCILDAACLYDNREECSLDIEVEDEEVVEIHLSRSVVETTSLSDEGKEQVVIILTTTLQVAG